MANITKKLELRLTTNSLMQNTSNEQCRIENNENIGNSNSSSYNFHRKLNANNEKNMAKERFKNIVSQKSLARAQSSVQEVQHVIFR